MTKNRLEAFSDGVIAIIITIMVLELKVPHGTDWQAISPLWPVISSYILSYIYLAIYWNNHHHLFQVVHSVNGGILWANVHLLFWLSLVPVTTAWMGESHAAPWPVALYGMVLLAAACAYYVLAHLLIAHHGKDSTLAKALGRDTKGKVSVVIYATAILAAFRHPLLACGLYGLVATIWLVPDRRIEKILTDA